MAARERSRPGCRSARPRGEPSREGIKPDGWFGHNPKAGDGGVAGCARGGRAPQSKRIVPIWRCRAAFSPDISCPLTPAQCVPNAATTWVPQIREPLRGTWSLGERENHWPRIERSRGPGRPRNGLSRLHLRLGRRGPGRGGIRQRITQASRATPLPDPLPARSSRGEGEGFRN
jgi:hypothetical protein